MLKESLEKKIKPNFENGKKEKLKQILNVNIYILSLYKIFTLTMYILNNVIINFIALACFLWRRN